MSVKRAKLFSSCNASWFFFPPCVCRRRCTSSSLRFSGWCVTTSTSSLSTCPCRSGREGSCAFKVLQETSYGWIAVTDRRRLTVISDQEVELDFTLSVSLCSSLSLSRAVKDTQVEYMNISSRYVRNVASVFFLFLTIWRNIVLHIEKKPRGFLQNAFRTQIGLFLARLPADLQLDYSLTDDFCRNHFLVGLLLREVGGAMQEFREVQQIAINVLKSLMIKHTFDDRYVSKVGSCHLIRVTLTWSVK